MRLEKIHIKGFKDPNRIVELEFSKEPITIVFGENGSGKTTLLKIIQAFLKNDATLLIKENVQEIKVTYTDKGRVYKVKLTIDAINNKTIINDFDAFKISRRTPSVLFGVNRGTTNILSAPMFENFNKGLLEVKSTEKSLSIKSLRTIEQLIQFTDWNSLTNMLRSLYPSIQHLDINNLNIEEVGDYIKEHHDKGQKLLAKKIKDAFFHTIDNAMEIAANPEVFVFPTDFWTRFEQQKALFQLVVNDLENSNTQRLRPILPRDRIGFDSSKNGLMQHKMILMKPL